MYTNSKGTAGRRVRWSIEVDAPPKNKKCYYKTVETFIFQINSCLQSTSLFIIYKISSNTHTIIGIFKYLKFLS